MRFLSVSNDFLAFSSEKLYTDEAFEAFRTALGDTNDIEPLFRALDPDQATTVVTQLAGIHGVCPNFSRLQETMAKLSLDS